MDILCEVRIKEEEGEIMNSNSDKLKFDAHLQVKTEHLDNTSEQGSLHSAMSSINTESSVSSWAEYPWVCGSCDTNLPSLSDLREHCVENHNNCFVAKCVDCTQNILNFNVFIAHVISHRQELKLYCKYCNYKSKDVDEASEHTDKHSKIENLCYKCGKMIVDEAHMTDYCIDKTNVTWEQCQWICSICMGVFKSVHKLRRHCIKEHNECFTAICVDCGLRINKYSQYVQHLRKHLRILKHYCRICNTELDSVREEIHISNVHKSNSELACPTCGLIGNKSKLIRHNREIKRIHNPQSKMGGYSCHICYKVMKNKWNYELHLEVHKKDRIKVYCDQCGKRFASKAHCNVHVLTIHDKTRYACEICKKQFKSSTRLRNHLVTHNPTKPFICDICSKGFKLKSTLKGHITTHYEDKKHVCSMCEKKFRTSSGLKIHLNQHTGAKPYNCSECPMKFSNWGNCNKHMIRRHGVTLSKTVLTPLGRIPLEPEHYSDISLEKLLEAQK